MSNLLSEGLLTAQDAASRHPIVEIKASRFADALPLNGQRLNVETLDQQLTASATLASGRLVALYTQDLIINSLLYPSTDVRLAYTDTERTEFFYSSLFNAGGGKITALSVVEMADGRLAIVYVLYAISKYTLKAAICNYDGTGLTHYVIKAAQTAAILSPSIARTATGYIASFITGDILYLTTATLPSAAWVAAYEAPVSGVASANIKLDTFLMRQADGTLWLFFTYQTAGTDDTNYVYNLLYSTSADNGGTWAAAVQVTSYTDSSEAARRPVALQKLATEIIVAYDSVKTSLKKDKTDAYWSDDAGQGIKYVQFNPANRKLYVVYGNTAYGARPIYGIVRVDVDSWAIDRYWNGNTTPSIPLCFREYTVDYFTGEGDLIFWCTTGISSTCQICRLDGAASDIRVFSLENDANYDITANVEGVEWKYADHYEQILSIAVDASTHLLYFPFYNTANTSNIKVFTMDYEATAAAVTEFCAVTVSIFGEYQENGSECLVKIDKENGYLIMSTGGDSTYAWHGVTRLFLINGGGLFKTYGYTAETPNFPFEGAASPVIIGNILYAGQKHYITTFEQENLWGMFSINLSTDVIRWYQPNSIITGGSQDITLRELVTTDDEKIICSTSYGVAVYNTITDSWFLINNDTVPSVFPAGYTRIGMCLAYDNGGQLVFGGVKDKANDFAGVVAFPLTGKIEQTQYYDVQYSGGAWAFGESAPLVTGQRDYDAGLAINPDTSGLYAFWTHWTSTEGYQLVWDMETAAFDVTSGLVSGQAIQQTRAIDGSAGRLTFTLEKGHLYDQHNRASLLAPYLQKGRKISLRWGQKIDGSDTWQTGESVYIVTGTKLTYQRGSYPSIAITCEDVRSFWGNIGIVATTCYAGITPDAALANILTSFANIAQTEQDFTALAGEDSLYYQWLDSDVKAATEAICDRYGYFLDVSLTDNKVRARKIGAYNAIDHVYGSADSLYDYSPDDSYSSFTNRVIVTGESREDIDISTAEESVATKAGTIGFFDCKHVEKIYYSEDKQRRVTQPRLEITQDSASIGFQMAGKMKTFISAVDVNGQWVEVTTQGPNLLPILLAGLGLFIGGRSMPPVVYVGAGGALSAPAESKAGAYMKDAGLWLILQCLAAVGNYAYEVHAYPIGQIRQTFQGEANDTVLQNELNGTIITQTIDEPLIYDVAQARKVAEQELWIAKAQRARVKLSKPAHLQDDAGDTITIPHVYTGQTQKIFITNLTRTMIEGREFTDDVEGWVI